MCVTFKPAHFGNTKIAVIRNPDGTETMIYQNNVRKPFFRPKPSVITGYRSIHKSAIVDPFAKEVLPDLNCMIFPIPAKSLTPSNVISTKDHPNLLSPLTLVIPRNETISRGFSFGSPIAKSASVWTDGAYTFVLSDSAEAITNALIAEGLQNRIGVPDGFVEAYAEWYTGWPILLALFDDDSEFDAHPICVRYQPLYQNSLFFPGLDAHGDGLPQKGKVEVDHVLIASTPELGGNGYQVIYEDQWDNFPLDELKPHRVIGMRTEAGSPLPNGDWWVNLSMVRSGDFHYKRIFPSDLPRSS